MSVGTLILGPFVAHRSSHDPDEVVEFLRPVAPGVSILPLSKDFQFDAKLTRLRATGLFRIRMDATNVLHGPGRPWVGVMVPLEGPAEIWSDGECVTHPPGTAHILSPDEPLDVRNHTGTGPTLVANIDQALVAKSAHRLGLADVNGHTQRTLNLRSKDGASFYRYMRFTWREAQSGGLLLRSRVASEETESALVCALLVASQTSDESISNDPADAALRRVEEYIVAHLREPIALADLAEVAGVRVETLIRAFKRRRGVTPMSFVRQRRLEEINRLLLGADPQTTRVTEVALRFGFTQLGRFAGTYKALFGETPSETLRS